MAKIAFKAVIVLSFCPNYEKVVEITQFSGQNGVICQNLGKVWFFWFWKIFLITFSTTFIWNINFGHFPYIKTLYFGCFPQISLSRPLASTLRPQTNTFLKLQISLYIIRPMASVPPPNTFDVDETATVKIWAEIDFFRKLFRKYEKQRIICW